MASAPYSADLTRDNEGLQRYKIIENLKYLAAILTGDSSITGSIGSISVEPLGQPVTARQLSAGSSSSNTALTSTVTRISIRATSADIRYDIRDFATIANSSSHFIAQNERLDLKVPLNANIAVLRNDSTDGVLEVTELT